MFCRSCGAAIADEDRFCTKCGAPNSSNSNISVAQPPARRSRRTLYVVIGTVGLLLFMAMCSAIFTDTPTKTESSGNLTTTSVTANRQYYTGQDVFVGYWAYRCIGAHWQRSIGSEYARQYPDAEFLVVDLAIRNNDKSASVLPPLKLVDSSGREYEESSKAIFMENSFGMLKNLNPGVSSRGYVVFDVPHGSYDLKVSGGFTSGEGALIHLY